MDKKRHKRKELLSLLVCVLMLTGMIAGCIPQSEIPADAGTSAANDTSSVATTIAEAADSVLGGAGLKEQAAASESTTQDTAIPAGESAVLKGYVPVAGSNIYVRVKALSYVSPTDFSQAMNATLRYGQFGVTPNAAVQLELEIYDYPNPQLPYLEDMMDLEFLSADGQVIATMRNSLYTYEGFDPLTAVQGQAMMPGWMILEVGEIEPACLRLITYDASGMEKTAYLALPQSDPSSLPAVSFTPTQVAVGDTLTDGGSTTRIIGIRQGDKVFTSAVGNEYYPADEGKQYIDVLMEYEGPQINVILNILASILEGDTAVQSNIVLLEQEDHQNFNRDFETAASGANRVHLVLPAPESEAPVQILFSINGTPYALDYTPGEPTPASSPLEKGGSDTVEGGYTVKIDKIAYGREVRSSISNNKYRLHEAESGNLFLIVTYRLKNLSEVDIIPGRDCGIYAIYDADAESDQETAFYGGQITRRAGAGDLDPEMPIAPGEESKVNYAFVEVPKAMKGRTGTIWFSVCDVLYSIPIPAK